MTITYRVAIVLVSSLFIALPAKGFQHSRTRCLYSPTSSIEDRFGSSIDIESGLLIIGDRNDDTAGTNAGCAWVVLHGPGGWVFLEKLIPSMQADHQAFGHAVSTDGRTVAIGSPGASNQDELPISAGSVIVYRVQASGLHEDGNLLHPDPDSWDRFGQAVALHGDTIAVGCPRDDTSGSDSGSVHMFRKAGGDWLHEGTLIPSDGEAHDQFGMSVSLGSDLVIIGAPGDDDRGLDSGAAWIFRRSPEGWIPSSKIHPRQPGDFQWFGFSVTTDDQAFAIGSPLAGTTPPNHGRVDIYGINGSKPELTRSIRSPLGGDDDWFGYSVDMSSGRLIIGSPGADLSNLEEGCAWIVHEVSGDWHLKKVLRHGSPQAGYQSGHCVGIDGEFEAMGRYDHEDEESRPGSVCVRQAIDPEYELSSVTDDGVSSDDSR